MLHDKIKTQTTKVACYLTGRLIPVKDAIRLVFTDDKGNAIQEFADVYACLGKVRFLTTTAAVVSI